MGMSLFTVKAWFSMFVITALFASSFTRGASSPAFTPEDLIAFPQESWVTNGGNLYNQRYSPLTQINRDNVGDLMAEWRVHMNGSGMQPNHSGQAQPLFYDGVLYVVTGENDVFAIDVETGEFVWTYQANLDADNVNVCCGWVSRGLGMGGGQIYLGRLDARLVALDQETGEVNWEIQAEDPHKGYSITSAPLYYNGMVITGFAGGELATRGRVKAYDAKDGSLLWTFYTIPGPGEFGHDTWPADNDLWQYGGAPVWQTPAIDPELGMIYFSTGNAAPDLDGSQRAGDNLFTVSIVALDVMTGEYQWHFQQVHHDIWDYDSPNPVILFDAVIDGQVRRGLAEASKTGFLYILDRVTGEPLIGIEERPVLQEPSQATAPTQPYPVGDPLVPQFIDAAPEGFKLVNQGRVFTPFGEEPRLYKPLAGVNWPPSSFDPETNLMYICANDRIGGARKGEQLGEPTHDRSWMGGNFALTDIPARGLFVAQDVTTNTTRWRQQWNYSCSQGSLVTAGGLIFIGRNDGRMTAIDKADGSMLWEFQTDAGVNGSATTFMHEGTQYVAVISAGTMFSPGRHGDSVWLFSLEGEMEEVEMPEETEASGEEAQPVTPPEGRTPDLAAGKQIYDVVCTACHGADGEGGHGEGGGPAFTAELSMVDILTVTSFGRENMPGFMETFTREQLHDIGAYILEELVE